ncbi:MAG: RdgB/HAM1 family non-canonical purine NTP pyrophosphatase [Candidatus Omnitrophica bacterium]|nr:RdgB/HAM1 family non-canonical purine NTP pyrophosphatase [Candidatus Omnitrophota bacterium]
MSPARKLLVATTNKKKLRELETLLSSLDLRLVCLGDLPSYEEAEENGETFEENAEMKALGYAKQTGLLTLGEDSGFCCKALKGAPGVYSARFAGPAKNDAENNQKVLDLLRDVPNDKRGAYFKSAVAIAEPGGLIGIVSGEVHGYVHSCAAGSHGFGYDPIFYYPPYGKTFGEVPAELKHKVSHRAKALKKTRELLEKYLLKSNCGNV